jgi:hypothetical protein
LWIHVCVAREALRYVSMSRFRVHNASALSARVVIARYGGRSL